MSVPVLPISGLSRRFFLLSLVRSVLVVLCLFAFFLFPLSTLLILLALYLYVSISCYRTLTSILVRLQAGGE